MTLSLSRAAWRQLALGAALACVALLVTSSQQIRRAERRMSVARTTLVAVRAELRTVRDAAAAGAEASAAQRAVIDSLWRVILTIRTADRQRRQVTMVPSDAVATPALLAQLTAERDTALVDRDLARAQVDSITGVVAVLRAASLAHLTEDSVRFATIGTAVVRADSGSAVAAAVLHRPWWRRVGGGLAATGRATAIATVAFLAGRGLR